VCIYPIGRKPVPVPNATHHLVAAGKQYRKEALSNISCGAGKEDFHSFSLIFTEDMKR
jgi:hypothetical protein